MYLLYLLSLLTLVRLLILLRVLCLQTLQSDLQLTEFAQGVLQTFGHRLSLLTSQPGHQRTESAEDVLQTSEPHVIGLLLTQRVQCSQDIVPLTTFRRRHELRH